MLSLLSLPLVILYPKVILLIMTPFYNIFEVIIITNKELKNSILVCIFINQNPPPIPHKLLLLSW